MESQPKSHILVLQFPEVTLKQIAVTGLKQLVLAILGGDGAVVVNFLPILSNRPQPVITILLKVRSKQRLFLMTSVYLWSALSREGEAGNILCYCKKQ